jgi:hypothetical protein
MSYPGVSLQFSQVSPASGHWFCLYVGPSSVGGAVHLCDPAHVPLLRVALLPDSRDGPLGLWDQVWGAYLLLFWHLGGCRGALLNAVFPMPQDLQ